jgi:hypothetical protein
MNYYIKIPVESQELSETATSDHPICTQCKYNCYNVYSHKLPIPVGFGLVNWEDGALCSEDCFISWKVSIKTEDNMLFDRETELMRAELNRLQDEGRNSRSASATDVQDLGGGYDN